ncbi:hypothetical protein HDV04_004220 [Boothiomyces sp. JEL0838]|nr:hypothetical protein HDV04_004220 [Boothiomyces sp. JEL0838]
MNQSQFQSEPSEFADLIYMHSHDVDSPLENLCKDPNCPMNHPQSEIQSSVKSSIQIDSKLEYYLNSIQKPKGEIHPDMYNNEIATEVDVESSISQQESRKYIPLQNNIAYRLAQQYAESTNVESLRAEMESELRAELEAEIRAEMEAKVRAELKSEFESQVGSNTTARPESNRDDIAASYFEEFQSGIAKFEEQKQSLKRQQMLELQTLQQKHLVAITALEQGGALPIDILKLRHSQEREIFELNEYFKRESIKANSAHMKLMQDRQKRMQLDQKARALQQQTVIVNTALVDSANMDNKTDQSQEMKGSEIAHYINPNDKPVPPVPESIVEKDSTNPLPNNEKKKKKHILVICSIQ